MDSIIKDKTLERKQAGLVSMMRSPSPVKDKLNDSIFDISDSSFERMEKLCDMLDDEQLKEHMPEFQSSDEEVEYILLMEKFTKQNLLSSTPNRLKRLSSIFVSTRSMSVDESMLKINTSPRVPIVDNTLDEVDLMLTVGNKLKSKEKFQYLSPKSLTSYSENDKSLKSVEKFSSSTPFVNNKRGTGIRNPIQIKSQNSELNLMCSASQGNRPQSLRKNAVLTSSFSTSPGCRAQLLRQKSENSFYGLRN